MKMPGPESSDMGGEVTEQQGIVNNESPEINKISFKWHQERLYQI